jgi:two-component system LytT family response regulator
MINIIIIEDEPATVRNLQATLKETGEDITVLHTLNGVKQSVNWFKENENGYDLVFMDIMISDGQSFEILDQVSINSPIIFVTAYDNYALQAFKTNGIDYILKPFQLSDLEQALQKFKRLQPGSESNPGSEKMLKLSGELKTIFKNYRQSFLFHFRDKLIPVATKDIAWFYTFNEVSHACSIDGRKFKTEFTLEQLQQQLDPADFYRANRQFIVQRKAISEVEFFFNGRLLIKTLPAADEHILVSKAKVPEFKAWMNA